MLPLKDAFLELSGTIVNASNCYDVWWELQNAENEEKYSDIINKYFAFFEANSGAQLVAMIVLLYQAYEKRRDTQNFHTLLIRIEEESNAKELLSAPSHGCQTMPVKRSADRPAIFLFLAMRDATSSEDEFVFVPQPTSNFSNA